MYLLVFTLALPLLIGWVSPGWSQDALRSGSVIAYSFAPLILAGLLISLFTAQLVRRDVRSPPLFEAIPSAAVLIAVLAAGQPTVWPLIIFGSFLLEKSTGSRMVRVQRIE